MSNNVIFRQLLQWIYPLLVVSFAYMHWVMLQHITYSAKPIAICKKEQPDILTLVVNSTLMDGNKNKRVEEVCLKCVFLWDSFEIRWKGWQRKISNIHQSRVGHFTFVYLLEIKLRLINDYSDNFWSPSRCFQ